MNYLTKKQLSILIFFIPLAFKMAMLPSLLYAECGATFYVGIGLITALEFVQLGIILKIDSAGGFSRIEKLYGKWLKILLSMPFLLSILIKTLIFSAEIYHYVSGYLFYNISSAPIIVTLCLIAFYVAVKGAKTVGRIYELSIWFIPIIIIFGIFFGKADLNADYLLPLFDDGVMPVVSGLDKYIIYTFDFSPLLFFRTEKGKNRSVVICSILSVIAITGCYMVFLVSYGRASFLIPDAFARLALFNTVVSEIGSLDWPSAILWITVALCNISLKLAAVGEIGSFVAIKKPISIGISAAASCFLLVFLLNSYEKVLSFATSWVRYVVVGIEIILPIIILALLKTKQTKEVCLEAQN